MSDQLTHVKSVFHKRFAHLSSAITNRLWLNAHTNYDCDVLLTFPARVDDNVIVWFLEKFLQLEPDVRISIKYHFTTGVYGFYLTFTYERILKGADALQLEKPIKQEFGGGYQIFLFDELEFYQGVEDEDKFFSTQERQSIVLHLLYSMRMNETQLLNGIKFKVDQSLIQRGLEKNGDMGVAKECFQAATDRFYTKALCLPAAYGVYIWYHTGQSQELDDKLFVINSFLNIIWATGFLIFWRRRQAELAYKWNTLDMEQLEETRATYKGELRRSPVTDKYEPYYPVWKRVAFRCLVTIPLLMINLVLVSISIVLIIRFQSWIDRQLKAGRLPSLMSLTELFPKILLALVTTIFDDVYKRVCRWLTDKENYREQRVHDNQMIAKMFACASINSYLGVFYIAFFTHKYIRLSDQLITIFVIKQFWDHVKEAIIPYIVSNTRLSVLIQMSKKEHDRYTEREELNNHLKRILDQWNTSKQTKVIAFNPCDSLPSFETLSLSQAEIECLQPKWQDLYEDSLELVVQFGYIIFLSTLFPLAAFFSLLNNILEIRTDAFKLCMIYQRPFSQRVKDIGHWQKIMEYMIVAAIIINCIFCSIRGVFRRMVPGLPFAAEIFLLVCIEHLLVLFCKTIRSNIESVPYWVRVEKAKMEYRRREALKKLECDALHNQSHGNDE
ncbi:unnamed protein product [Adineta ricciae]|uniref:Anoctamin n=1 Tax=Adineta ricciae TaxID=249248 RepID=A0A814EBJ0_ADIRI|nr:unnamed protein product [Adineta ricciae]